MAERIPPGRAGRLWLLGRLDYARRSLELLDHKHALLRQQLEGLAQAREEARDRWDRTCSAAERWSLRAAALGGAADIAVAAAAVADQARVIVPWHNTMGVLHPGEPTCSLPALSPSEGAAGNAAIAPAADAHREALLAAATFAAHDRSYRLLSFELVEPEERLVSRWAHHRHTPSPRATDTRAGPA